MPTRQAAIRRAAAIWTDRRRLEARRTGVRRTCIPWRRLGSLRLITPASARQIGCCQPLANPTCMPLHGQVHDLEADSRKTAQAFCRELRKEAYGREARNGVDLVEVKLWSVKQEVNSGKALATDGAIGLKCHLADLPAKAIVQVGPDLGHGGAVAVLGHVVVELAAGEDLARPKNLQRARVVAQDRHLQFAWEIGRAHV